MAEEQPNEIVAAARHHKAAKERAQQADAGKRWPLGAIGLGVGIGSAAVAAAMLFAGRGRKD